MIIHSSTIQNYDNAEQWDLEPMPEVIAVAIALQSCDLRCDLLAVHLQLCRLPSTHDHHLKSFLSVFPESQWKNVILGDGTFSTIYLGAKWDFWHIALTVWVFEASLPDWFCLTWAKSICHMQQFCAQSGATCPPLAGSSFIPFT